MKFLKGVERELKIGMVLKVLGVLKGFEDNAPKPIWIALVEVNVDDSRLVVSLMLDGAAFCERLLAPSAGVGSFEILKVFAIGRADDSILP